VLRVNAELAEHAADRVGVTGEPHPRRRRVRLRASYRGPAALVENAEMTDQRLETVSVSGRGDDHLSPSR